MVLFLLHNFGIRRTCESRKLANFFVAPITTQHAGRMAQDLRQLSALQDYVTRINCHIESCGL